MQVGERRRTQTLHSFLSPRRCRTHGFPDILPLVGHQIDDSRGEGRHCGVEAPRQARIPERVNVLVEPIVVIVFPPTPRVSRRVHFAPPPKACLPVSVDVGCRIVCLWFCGGYSNRRGVGSWAVATINGRRPGANKAETRLGFR